MLDKYDHVGNIFSFRFLSLFCNIENCITGQKWSITTLSVAEDV